MHPFLKVKHVKMCLRREIVACLWMCPLSLQSILLFILEKGQLDALSLSCSCQAPDRGPHLLLLLPYQPFPPHRLSPGFGPRWLGKKQLSEVTMGLSTHKAFHHVIWLCWAISPTLSLVYFLAVFHFLNPYSLKTFIPPLSSLGQLLLCPQESKQMPLSPGSFA